MTVTVELNQIFCTQHIQRDIARYVVLRIPPLKNFKSNGKQEVDVQ